MADKRDQFVKWLVFAFIVGFWASIGVDLAWLIVTEVMYAK